MTAKPIAFEAPKTTFVLPNFVVHHDVMLLIVMEMLGTMGRAEALKAFAAEEFRWASVASAALVEFFVKVQRFRICQSAKFGEDKIRAPTIARPLRRRVYRVSLRDRGTHRSV